MTAKGQTKPVYNDKERLEWFLSLLPKDFFTVFVGYLEGGCYPAIYNERLQNYTQNIESLFFVFDNEKIKNTFGVFKKDFHNLLLFLLGGNFFRINSYSDFVGLYPDHTHSSVLEDKKLWQEKFDELQKLIEQSKNSYYTLLTVARDELSDKEIQVEEDFSTDIQDSKKPKTKIIGEIGYLIFHGQKIKIGEFKDGKFRLIEMLCVPFRKSNTIDLVFEYTKTNKDKNKIDSSLDSFSDGRKIKLQLIRNQMKEINRAITNHVEKLKISKKFKYRLSIKCNRKSGNIVWLGERTVG